MSRAEFNRSHRKPRLLLDAYLLVGSLVFHTCQALPGSGKWVWKTSVFCCFQGSAEALTIKLVILKLHSEHNSYARFEFCVRTWSHGTQKHWKLALCSCFKYFKILFLKKLSGLGLELSL